MKTPLCDQETTISIMRGEKAARIFCSDYTIMKKLDELTEKSDQYQLFEGGALRRGCDRENVPRRRQGPHFLPGRTEPPDAHGGTEKRGRRTPQKRKGGPQEGDGHHRLNFQS